jgi:uncharacterized protein (TIGR02145 family)
MRIRFFYLITTIFLLIHGAFNLSDGQSQIRTVEIGKQVWTLDNLQVETFRNGDIIPEARTNEEWEKAYKAEKPAWCFYNNDPSNEKQLGKLYNWFAVNDARGIAPFGFHVPSKTEWETLMLHLGDQAVAGKKLKHTQGWPENGNGSNESGFSGLPGGMRFYNGVFDKERKYGHWWTTTPLPPFYAWQFYLLHTDDALGFYSLDFGKGAGMSVRCVAD